MLAIPDRKRVPTDMEHLEWMESDDGSLTLWDRRLDETFHGGCGAVTESIVVYVLNGGVLDRLAGGNPTRVLEIGLGTGTNFLLTAALAEHHQTQLQYTVVEPHLLEPSVIAQLGLARRLQDQRARQFAIASDSRADAFFAADYSAALKAVTRHFGKSYRSDWSQRTELRIGEFTQLTVLPHRLEHVIASEALEETNGRFHCIYFDAFSPKNSPGLWTGPVFAAMRRQLARGSCMVTYCVKGSVRREMQSAGFKIEKLPGPHAGKREVLRAS